jgi:hypothetical protein
VAIAFEVLLGSDTGLPFRVTVSFQRAEPDPVPAEDEVRPLARLERAEVDGPALA